MRTTIASLCIAAALGGCAQQRTVVLGNASTDAPVVAAQRQASDAAMAAELLAANYYDIEAARLALERSRSGLVKSYARMLLQQHEALHGELVQLVRSRRGQVPSGPPQALRQRLAQLGAVRAENFDREYIRRAGVEDHAARVRVLERMQAETADPELKAWVARFLPMARGQQLQAESISAMLLG